MENASKALLIAGGVLITMIVASFGVYLYGVYHEHSENMLAAMSEKEISEFNAKFTSYQGKDLTANDVVSIMNLVRDNNLRKIDDEYRIEINTNGWYIDGKGYIQKIVDEPDSNDYEKKCITFLKDNAMDEEYIFKLNTVTYNENTGLVNAI